MRYTNLHFTQLLTYTCATQLITSSSDRHIAVGRDRGLHVPRWR